MHISLKDSRAIASWKLQYKKETSWKQLWNPLIQNFLWSVRNTKSKMKWNYFWLLWYYSEICFCSNILLIELPDVKFISFINIVSLMTILLSLCHNIPNLSYLTVFSTYSTVPGLYTGRNPPKSMLIFVGSNPSGEL